jgi:hypothetical protein
MCLYYLEDFDGDTYIADMISHGRLYHYAYYSIQRDQRDDIPDFSGSGWMYARTSTGSIRL